MNGIRRFFLHDLNSQLSGPLLTYLAVAETGTGALSGEWGGGGGKIGQD